MMPCTQVGAFGACRDTRRQPTVESAIRGAIGEGAITMEGQRTMGQQRLGLSRLMQAVLNDFRPVHIKLASPHDIYS